MADPNIPNLEPRVAVLEQIAHDLVSELRGLRQDFRDDIKELRGEIGGLRKEMRDEVGGLCNEISGLRKDLRDDFRLLITRQDRQFYIVLTIMLAGFGGMLATMAHGFKWI
jgi:hypothetical protein